MRNLLLYTSLITLLVILSSCELVLEDLVANPDATLIDDLFSQLNYDY